MAGIAYNYFRSGKKQTSAILKFFFGFDCDHIPQLPCHSTPICRTSSKSDYTRRSDDVISILKIAAAVVQFTSGFGWDQVTFFGMSMSISTPNFVRITQSATEIWLFPVWKYKRPSYWNYSSSFDHDHIAVIGMLFCISLPNFIQIGLSVAEEGRCIVLVDLTVFRRSKSIR